MRDSDRLSASQTRQIVAEIRETAHLAGADRREQVSAGYTGAARLDRDVGDQQRGVRLGREILRDVRGKLLDRQSQAVKRRGECGRVR